MKQPAAIFVEGIDVDEITRCAHYHGPLDIVAIKFKCCGRWFSCIDCHKAVTGHSVSVWTAGEPDERAILCGKCGALLSIDEYLKCAFACPECKAAFNPRCENHYHHYFELGRAPAS